VPSFDGDIVLVNNYQLNSQADLCGSVVEPERPSALKVAPCFLPVEVAGDYWVIHVESASDGTYKWALVSGGPPTTELPGGCFTENGLWIFSRAPKLPQWELQKAERTLVYMGLTLERLQRVRQVGCTYEGAGLKP